MLRELWFIGVLAAAMPAFAHDPIPHEIVEVDEAIALQGPVVALLVLRAHLWLLDDNPRLALRDLDMAEAIGPRDAAGAVLRGRALHMMGRDDEALRVLAGSAPTYASRMLEGAIHEEAGRMRQALVAFEYASSRATTVDVSLARGRCLRRLRRSQEAVVVYRESLGALEGATLLRRELVATLVTLRRFREAREVIRAARGHARESVLWDLRDARVLRAMGRVREARTLQERVRRRLEGRIHRRPTAARWLQHGEVLRDLGRVEEARRSARRALTLAPRYEPARALAEELGL